MWLSLKPEDNILCLRHNTFVGSMRFGRCCSRKGLGSNPRRVFCVESLHVLSRPVWVFSRYSVIPSQYKDINQIRLINWWINCRYKCERELLSVFMCISPPTEGRTVPESSPLLALLQLPLSLKWRSRRNRYFGTFMHPFYLLLMTIIVPRNDFTHITSQIDKQ